MNPETHKLAAIVFTDVVGFTKSMEADEQKTMQLLQKQRDILFPLIKSFRGEVIKEMGDGLMMMFNSAIDAVRFAICAQTRLKEEDFSIRAGIHIGDVIFKGEDIFGSAVNIAARIEPLASPNGICISNDVRLQLKNKSEINAQPLGRKMLKGVKEPLEVFEVFIEGVSEKRRVTLSYLVKDLWSRKVIQILLGYGAASWMIRIAVGQITNTYLLSPHLADLVMVILLSLTPAVGILAYFHGKESNTGWTKMELFGVPANVILSALLVVFMFKGRDLGAATSTLIVENEDGTTEARVIYKDEFRINVAIFPFTNNSRDTSLYWMQFAIPTVLGYDLSSNLKIQYRDVDLVLSEMMDAGYSLGDEIPIMLLRDIANLYHSDFFITGTFDKTDEGYNILTSIYNSKNAVLLHTFDYGGTNFFQLIDQMTARVAHELKADPGQLEHSKDLPVADIFTSSERAMKYFIKGQIEIAIHNNLDSAIYFKKKAIEEDPNFALAQFILGSTYFQNNDLVNAERTLDNTMKIIYKLPEQQQYYFKYLSYIIKEEVDKALAVLEMWADIFPDDVEPHEILATRYQYRGNFQASIKEYEVLLALDASQTHYYRYIGDLYRAIGHMDSARMYYVYYLEQCPEDYKAYRNLGEMYLETGEFDKASEFIDKAMILESNEVDLAITRLSIDYRTGNYHELDVKYLELLEKCTNVQDSASVLMALSDYYNFRGMTEESLKFHRMYLVNAKKFIYPLNYEVLKLFHVHKYVIAGKRQEALGILESCKEKLDPPVNKIVAFGYLIYYEYGDSIQLAEPYMQEAWDFATGFGEEMLLSNYHYAKGHLYEAKGNFDQAIKEFELYKEKSTHKIQAYFHIARCYRKMGSLKKAKKTIQKALIGHPFAPKVNYEAYLIYKADGDDEKGMTYLLKANQVWEQADEGYMPAMKAREAMKNRI